MFLTQVIDRVVDSALALIYPQPCHVCGKSVESRADGFACSECWVATRVFSESDPVCWKCGAFARGTTSPALREQVRCRACEEDAFTAARACGIYEKALRANVLALKRQPHLSSRIIQLLSGAARKDPLNRCTCIVPVPLHPERQRVRGFNQAELISTELSRVIGVSLAAENLFRVLHTERHRAGMDAKARRQTVESAFAVRVPRLLRNQDILLVDDVFTSGATASACAGALVEAGARSVFVLTIARTMKY